MTEVESKKGLTKDQLVAKLADLKKTTLKEAREAFDSVVDVLKAELDSGRDVRIPGFGTFQVKYREARMGRNPKTGESIEISGCRTVGFKPASQMKVRDGGELEESRG